MSTDRMFDGGGEMGSLMRSFDWSKTALGPVSGWSPALKTMIGVVLRSPSPMYLVWGPQFLQLYNDAYRPTLAAKHPILGEPASDSWAGAWLIAGPTYAAALAGQPATWSEDQPLLINRNGFVEETYYKAAIVPVPDETTASGIGGVLSTLIETTEQVHRERQRKTLQRVATRAAGSHSPEQVCAATAASLGENASDVPFCLFYLLSQDSQEAYRVAQSGFGPGSTQANPEVIALTASSVGAVGWPLASIVNTRASTVLKDLPGRFGEPPNGGWSQSPRIAIAVPLASPDQAHPYGVMIAGVNPHRGLDDGYQAFFELVAAQVVTAINAGALARVHADAERDRTWLFAQLMQAPVAVCILTGPESVFSLANPLYLEMAGRKEVVGKSLRTVYSELEPDSPVFQLYEGVFSTGVPYVAEEFSVAIDKGNGGREDMYFRFTAQPVRDAAGKVTDVMVVAVDVTAQVLARRRIESLVRELKEADQRKDEFLATLAHELRNPMAAISTALSLLESSDGDRDKDARHQATARRQMKGLVRMVDDLLDVSRINRGTVELRKERINLSAIVHNAANVTRGAVEARGHQIEVSEGEGAFTVDVDATRIEQVVVNLLTNATKYTDPGGKISVRLDREGVSGAAEAVLRVRDSGRGIAVEMLDKIFDLFVQVVPSLDRSTGGLGVGLTLVKRMVELHGGTVRAHSEGPGMGSEFVVRLPLAPEELPRAETEEVGARKLSVFTEKRRVLLVEDGEDVRNTLQEFLAELGHEVSVAVDGLQGVAKILELLPDVSFVDLGLPGIDGYEVARRVRASTGGGQLNLVALTGYGGSDVRAKAKEAGFNHHLTKPVDVSELLKLVSNSRA